MKSAIPVLTTVLLVLSGCIGFVFGPGYSSADKNYFAEPPVILKKDEQYILRWRYGSMGFHSRPSYKAKRPCCQGLAYGNENS